MLQFQTDYKNGEIFSQEPLMTIFNDNATLTLYRYVSTTQVSKYLSSTYTKFEMILEVVAK